MSDDEGFAKDVYEYVYALLEKQQQFPEGKNLRISAEQVRLAENNEIHIDEGTHVPEGMIKWILKSFLKSDSTKFKDYGFTQFEDTFTIGKTMSLTEMGIYTCDLCNYSTLYQEQLYGHRMMHYFGIS